MDDPWPLQRMMFEHRREHRPGVAAPLAATVEHLKQETPSLVAKVRVAFVIATDSTLPVVAAKPGIEPCEERRPVQLLDEAAKQTPGSQQGNLKADQRGWVKGRDDCWQADDKRRCIKAEYQARIKELKDR